MYTTYRKQQGFTLLEVIIALSIGAAVAAIITLVTSTGLKNIRASRQSERVQANVQHATEAIAYWTKGAILANVPSVGTLELTVPTATSYTTVTIQRSVGRVTLNGSAITSDDVAISSLAFTRFPRSVRVALTARSAESPAVALSVTTTTALRNSF